jgi:hypothetical protein
MITIYVCTPSVCLYVRMSVFYQSPRYDIQHPVSHRHLGQYTDTNGYNILILVGYHQYFTTHDDGRETLLTLIPVSSGRGGSSSSS